jgi:ferric-dicitrate binding protein FerR (iron transport regulator)
MQGRVATLALIAVFIDGPALGAGTGTVVFNTGPATLIDHDDKSVPVAKDQQVGPGDLLRTGHGQVQVRFPDGTYVSLGPDSDLRVDAYRYSGQPGARDAAFFTLYRGVVRFLTGAVASGVDGRFRLNTAFGTLHADAAEFSVRAAQNLQVSVGAGQVHIRNQAGALQVGAGQRGLVAEPSAPPLLIGTIVPAPVTPR